MFIKYDATAWLSAITTIGFYIKQLEPDDLIRHPIGVH
jgi:hypothetical protein